MIAFNGLTCSAGRDAVSFIDVTTVNWQPELAGMLQLKLEEMPGGFCR
jgi:hypothetical protein